MMLLAMAAIAGLGARSADQPLLIRSLGALANQGRADLCALYPTHPKLRDRVAEIDGKINAARRTKLESGFHVRATVPSVEIYGVTEKGARVPLLEDASGVKTRAGKEAAELIDLTNSLCQEK